jgi:hypothetical protein
MVLCLGVVIYPSVICGHAWFEGLTLNGTGVGHTPEVHSQ